MGMCQVPLCLACANEKLAVQKCNCITMLSSASDFCSRPRLTQPYNHIICPGVAKIYLVFFWRPWLLLRRVVNIAAELFLRRSHDRGGVKIAKQLCLCVGVKIAWAIITGTNPYFWTLTDPRGGIILNNIFVKVITAFFSIINDVVRYQRPFENQHKLC